MSDSIRRPSNYQAGWGRPFLLRVMCVDVPRDAYWAWGLGDSLIVVIPSLDLVIARTGNDPDDTTLPQLRADWNGDFDVLVPFVTPIAQSVTDAP